MEHRDIIVARHESGADRDAIIIHLVTEAGLSLNAATKAYAAVAKAEGWSTGRESHKEAALDWLKGCYTVAELADDTFEAWDAAAVKAAVPSLQDRFGIAESTARDYCKAFSEELGVPYPVEDPRAAMFGFLVNAGKTADPSDADDLELVKQAFKEFAGEGGLGRSASNVNEYWKGYELAMAILEARS